MVDLSTTSAVAKSLAANSGEFRNSLQDYLKHIRKAKEAVRIPVIASLNGTTPGGWTQYSKEIQRAGANKNLASWRNLFVGPV